MSQHGRWESTEGAPRPLGATWVDEERAWNFALYSKHAERVTLLLFTADDPEHPHLELLLDPLKQKSGRIWHCRLGESVVGPAIYYGYRVGGPAPEGRHAWHAFDESKVLIDPYASAVHYPPAFDRAAASAPGSDAGRAPLGVIRGTPPFDWGDDRAPAHQSDTIIYELHVRGFTRDPSAGVAERLRGTYAGLVEKVPYLRELGITAVELMPVFQFEPGEDYWGYNPLSWFAPHRQYYAVADDARTEFRAMVRALHAARIEVLLDVVYNHTCEGGRDGPTYSFKGIDNSTYYLSSGSARQPWADYTGCGNTVNAVNQHVRSMIADSMRFWTDVMHVDGFRFDLASVFTRDEDGGIGPEEVPIFGALSGDPDFARMRLIAEPWDPAGAMELGRAFPGVMWQQWNADFRDDVRRFVRGDEGFVPRLMRRMYGSDDLFPDDRMHAYHPWQGINYVTSHDGFTLYDLLAYTTKRNWENGEGNRDGPAEEFSSNCGWEGDDRVPDTVVALRRRQAKNFLALLLLANGTPMFRAGDEFLHTQRGNSNPWNQDNATSWLDWRRLDTHAEVFRFARLMIAFRKAHPSIGRSRFWRDDIAWHGTGPTPDLSSQSRAVAWLLRGASQGDVDLYVMINASPAPLSFAIQDPDPSRFDRVVDTGQVSPEDFVEEGVAIDAPSYLVQARSLVLLSSRA